VLTGSIVNNAYDPSKDRIELLYKDGSLRDIAEASDNLGIVIPGMIARRSGHLINIGSLAGKEVYPKGNVYCATKHAVDALTKGMRQDLLPYGIKVTQIAPGLAQTEFSLVRFHGDAQRAEQPYAGITPLNGDDIADLVWFAVNLPPHVCINDLVVTPTAQASSTLVQRG
jgi:3-hydroxy acid dehydrogenase/malonic semialdehyde reductase